MAALTYANMLLFARTAFPALSLICVLLAAAAALIRDSDLVSGFLIRHGFTRKTAHRSVLADVIATHPDCYMKFRYKSGGYVIGHPRRYSLDGEESAIFLDNAARRPPKTGTAAQPPEAAIAGPGVLILSFDDISAVEVLHGVKA